MPDESLPSRVEALEANQQKLIGVVNRLTAPDYQTKEMRPACYCYNPRFYGHVNGCPEWGTPAKVTP